MTPNKQFKSDSARVAFLVWVESSDYSSQIESRGRVLHTLIGRYVFHELRRKNGNFWHRCVLR
ncbi:TPA: hypothetical protein I7701_21850 [Vibrio vulnificus]|nr:hypothetical protein [Vibrio vulnificus]